MSDSEVRHRSPASPAPGPGGQDRDLADWVGKENAAKANELFASIMPLISALGALCNAAW